MVPYVRSWWNFHRHFWWMFPPIWHHLQVHQECPCPPRLQEETWRTGGVLTWFLMSDPDETFTDTYDGCSLPFDTISRSARNVHVLLDSSKGLGGQVESQHTSWSQILIKLSQMLLMDVPSHLTLSPGHQKIRIYEDIWKTWKVFTWFLMSDLDETFTDTSDGCSLPSDTISRFIRNVHVLLDSGKRLGGLVES